MITSVIAVVAVISPVLTAWINNHYKNLADQRINDDKLRVEKQKQEEAKHQKFIEQTVLQKLLIDENDKIGPMEQDRYQMANDQFSIIASKLRELINSLPKE